MWSLKYSIVWWLLSENLLFEVNSEKNEWFFNNSENGSINAICDINMIKKFEECDIKSEKSVYYCLVVTLWKCLNGLSKPWKGWLSLVVTL